MFLAVLGTKVKPDFWEKYNALKKITYPENMQLSFQEDAIEVREFCNSKEAESLPCYVGGVTFHIKCNGDVYGCCLCGGEAIKTQEAMKLGNIRSESISKIQRAYKPTCHYKKGSPCSEACQWKQLAVNRMVHAAKDVTLTMP
jgi:MoaA/NifB/PqqE/SkfB family radical SAM enzyme